MKKLIMLLLIVLFGISLVGCIGEDSSTFIISKIFDMNVFDTVILKDEKKNFESEISFNQFKEQEFFSSLSTLTFKTNEGALIDRLPPDYQLSFINTNESSERLNFEIYEGENEIGIIAHSDIKEKYFINYTTVMSKDIFEQIFAFFQTHKQLQNNNSGVPLETFECITYVDGDTYGYDDVVKLNGSSYDSICENFNLNKENDFYVINDSIKYHQVYFSLTGEYIYSTSYKETNKPNIYNDKLDNVMLLIRRTAKASNEIPVIYQDNTYDNKLEVTFPYESEPGDEALFNCFDLVTIPKNEFYRLYPEYNTTQIPFELITDDELLYFYNKSIIINDIYCFYGVITTQDLETSTRLAKVHERYNEEYFKEYSLGIVKFATCSSESGITLKQIKYEDNQIITIFDIESEYLNTEDIIYKYFVFQIKKEDINKLIFSGLKESSYEIEIKVNNTLHPELGSSHYEKYEKNEYKLIVNNFGDQLYEKLNETYKAGEIVTVKVRMLYDAGIAIFLDNKCLGLETYVTDGNYWEYYFTMPDHDATLSLRIYDGFNNYNEYVKEDKYLPNDVLVRGLQEEIVYNYLTKFLSGSQKDELGYIKKYYGFYNNTFAVMMTTTTTGCWFILGKDIIDGVEFNYNDSYRIYAYNDGNFYQLQEAFDKGLLTHNDLVSIINFENQDGESDCTKLENTIKDMTTTKFLQYFNEYNVFSYRGYAFFEYKDDYCVTVIFTNDYKSIQDCYVYKKHSINNEVISNIKTGMSTMDVVKIIGIPKTSVTFGLSTLAFVVNEKIVVIYLDGYMNVYDVKVSDGVLK